jgi:predicted HAD superfamily Cof-like phosphohydrolase
MKTQIQDVVRFHKTYNHPIGDIPMNLTPDRAVLRHRLILEECQEYLYAAMKGDLVETADALGDLLYVVFGAAIEHGLHDRLSEIFRAIQNSNMSKLGSDGKPIYDEGGKVLKGPNYYPPTSYIKNIINENKKQNLINWISAVDMQELCYQDRDTFDDLKEFEDNVEGITGIPWSIMQINMNPFLDLGDTIWYELLGVFLIKNECGLRTLYKLVKD